MFHRTLPSICALLLAAACSADETNEPIGDAGSSGGPESDPAATTGSTGDASTTDDTPADPGSDGGSTGEPMVDCSDRPTARPTPRGEIDGIWDSARGRLVFFGGDQGIPQQCMSQTDFVGETWAFHPDCDNFERLSEEGAPSARGRHAVAYDTKRQWMIVHGGRFRAGVSGEYTLYDDTWALDLATDTWSRIATGGPTARANHTAVVSGDRLIVFGGNASNDGLVFAPLGDLWALDLDEGQWQQLGTTGGPSSRLFHAAAVSDDGSKMFVYGGGDESAFTGPFFAELWQLDLSSGQWTRLDESAALSPVRSIWGDLLYDGASDSLVLWGAHEDNLLGNNNKIWRFDLASSTWSMLEEGDVLQSGAAGFCDFPVDFVAPDLDAPERRSAGAAVLTDDGELLVFGGRTDCGIIDDVWSFSFEASEWSRRLRATFGEICPRAFAEACSTMCY